MYGLSLVSGPVAEPVSTDEAKAWLRLEHSSDDTLIAGLVAAARGVIERLIGRQLVTASWLLTLDAFPWPGGWQFIDAPGLFPDPHTIRLPKAPLQSVSSIQYYDFGDVLRTLDTSVYDVDVKTDPGRISLAMAKVWPVTRLKPGAVRITFTAGYGAANAVPEELKTAIKMTVAWWYEHRGDDAHQLSGLKLPMAVESLLYATWNGELEYGTP